MKKVFNEFKEFSIKGNMIDIAIGVIIGTAFNKVVDAIVKQIFLPPLSLLTNGATMANKKIILREAQSLDGIIQTKEVSIGYGEFIEVTVDFLIISLVIFIVVKFMNTLKGKAQDANDDTVTTPKDIELLDKVAKLLEEQNQLLKSK